jgi:hypothetical protein
MERHGLRRPGEGGGDEADDDENAAEPADQERHRS